MLNPNPDTGIDSILNLNTESTTLVDVPITSNAEMPPSPATTPPPPHIPPIQPLVKALEDDFSEFKQTNQFAVVVSSIPGIVDTYLANKMNEAVKTATINEQLKAEVLTHSSNEAKISHVVAANLSELELKKILIDKMENTVTIKRCRDDQDEDAEPSAGSNQGSKRRRAGKEPESTSAPKEKTSKSSGKSKEGSKSHNTYTGKSAQAEEPIHADKDLEEPAHQEFDTGITEDQPIDETTQYHDCNLAQKEDTRDSFNELMDTPLNFSAFMMIYLKVDTLTP
ncbi:hypothetical protein Tco_0721820 [Tanacetum coccineum]